jgi:heme/copper-type cytochrome/quinol oxidase subunit 4
LTALYFVVIAQTSVLYWSLSDCLSTAIITVVVCMGTVILMRAPTNA